MSDTFSRVEVITGVARRRRFTTEQKLAVVAETMQPGMSISYVARRHGLSPNLVFRWRRLITEGGQEAVRADDEVVPASDLRRLEERVRELERQDPASCRCQTDLRLPADRRAHQARAAIRRRHVGQCQARALAS
jgi:transposase